MSESLKNNEFANELRNRSNTAPGILDESDFFDQMDREFIENEIGLLEKEEQNHPQHLPQNSPEELLQQQEAETLEVQRYTSSFDEPQSPVDLNPEQTAQPQETYTPHYALDAHDEPPEPYTNHLEPIQDSEFLTVGEDILSIQEELSTDSELLSQDSDSVVQEAQPQPSSHTQPSVDYEEAGDNPIKDNIEDQSSALDNRYDLSDQLNAAQLNAEAPISQPSWNNFSPSSLAKGFVDEAPNTEEAGVHTSADVPTDAPLDTSAPISSFMQDGAEDAKRKSVLEPDQLQAHATQDPHKVSAPYSFDEPLDTANDFAQEQAFDESLSPQDAADEKVDKKSLMQGSKKYFFALALLIFLGVVFLLFSLMGQSEKPNNERPITDADPVLSEALSDLETKKLSERDQKTDVTSEEGSATQSELEKALSENTEEEGALSPQSAPLEHQAQITPSIGVPAFPEKTKVISAISPLSAEEKAYDQALEMASTLNAPVEAVKIDEAVISRQVMEKKIQSLETENAAIRESLSALNNSMAELKTSLTALNTSAKTTQAEQQKTQRQVLEIAKQIQKQGAFAAKAPAQLSAGAEKTQIVPQSPDTPASTSSRYTDPATLLGLKNSSQSLYNANNKPAPTCKKTTISQNWRIKGVNQTSAYLVRTQDKVGIFVKEGTPVPGFGVVESFNPQARTICTTLGIVGR